MIMDYIYGGTVDIHSSVPTFQIKQYDNNSHKLHFKLIDKDNPVSSTVDLTGYTVKAYFRLPNGSDEFVSCEVMEAETGRIAVPFPGSVTQLAGQVSCEIRITGENGYVLSLRKFYFDVLKSIRDDSVIEASEKYSALDDSLLTVGALQNQINALVASPAGSGGDTGTELRDIRIGVDGTEYDSAGEAVRAQITDLHNEVARIDDAIEAVGRTAINSWQGVQAIVRAGLASRVFSIGDQFTCQRDGVDLVWDVIGIDHDTPADPQYTHSLTLQLHDCFPTTMQYDASEAFYYASEGLEAGTYYFTIDSSYETAKNTYKDTGYQFTLSQDVPAGGQIGLIWKQNANASTIKVSSFASADSLSAQETVSIVSGTTGSFIGNLTALGDTANHLNFIARARYGNNNYALSNIRQWLNSKKTAGQVYEAKTDFDRSPEWADSQAGFMCGMDADFLAVVGETRVVTAKPSPDGGGSDITNDKFFLISRNQAYCGNETAEVDEGSAYPYYSSLQNVGTGVGNSRIKYLGGSALPWVMRTPIVSGSFKINGIKADGTRHDDYWAHNSRGIAPACNII